MNFQQSLASGAVHGTGVQPTAQHGVRGAEGVRPVGDPVPRTSSAAPPAVAPAPLAAAPQAPFFPAADGVSAQRRAAHATKSKRSIPPLDSGVAAMLTESGYTVSSVLGQGAFGTVYKAQLSRPSALAPSGASPVYVAIKCIHIADGVTVPFTTYREIALLKELKHATIMRLYEAYFRIESPGYICIVCEYLDQDLAKRIDRARHSGGLPLLTVKKYLYQIVKGLSVCHELQIIHRDIKPENILINTATDQAKLGDFGLMRSVGIPARSLATVAGTLWYRAPEILFGAERYGPPVDMWSAGCVFYEMVTCAPLFPASGEESLVLAFEACLGKMDEAVWAGCTSLRKWGKLYPAADLQRRQQQQAQQSPLHPVVSSEAPAVQSPSGLPLFQFFQSRAGVDAAGLLEELLRYNPARRISAHRALNHPYFTQGTM